MFIIRLVGDARVGKSAFIRAASKQPFSENYSSHESGMVDCAQVNITPPSSEEKINFFLDGGGKAAKKGMPEVIFLMFALDDEESFNHLEAYLPDAPKPTLFVVGCKADQAIKGGIDHQAWAEEHHLPYWEISAKTGENIEALLQDVAGIFSLVREFEAPLVEENNAVDEAHDAGEVANEPKALSYSTFMGKLSPGPEFYLDIKSIADDIPLINTMTQTIEDNKHSKDRDHFRKALTNALKHHYSILLNKWDDPERIFIEIDALQKIKDTLTIIQPKATQDYREKSAMLHVKHLIDALNKHYELSFLKKKLDGEKAREEEFKRKILDLADKNQIDDKPQENKDDSQFFQVKDAITILAKAPVLSPDFLRHLVNNHLISPMNKNKHPNLVDAMKELSKEEKSLLKNRLIEATKLEMLSKNLPENKKTNTHLALEEGMENTESNLPLIAILRISGSGKINADTKHYKTWLGYMKGKVDPATQGYLGTFWKRSVESITHRLDHIKKPKPPK